MIQIDLSVKILMDLLHVNVEMATVVMTHTVQVNCLCISNIIVILKIQIMMFMKQIRVALSSMQ